MIWVIVNFSISGLTTVTWRTSCLCVSRWILSIFSFLLLISPSLHFLLLWLLDRRLLSRFGVLDRDLDLDLGDRDLE